MSRLDELIAAMRGTAESKPVAVKVKGWGVVHVKPVTVAEVEDQTADTEDKKDKHRLARAAARVMCDEGGTRLFDPGNAEHVQLLASQPWVLLRKVLSAADLDADSGN